MLIKISNGYLTLTVSDLGAQVVSIKRNNDQLELLWDGDPQIWGWHAPLLFPFVGVQKDAYYTIQKKRFTMPPHGFARDMAFNLIHKSNHEIGFILQQSEETLAIYPYKFTLFVRYRLMDNAVQITYTIENEHHEVLPFSIGAHPAFRIPIFSNQDMEDYYLMFEYEETVDCQYLRDGLLDMSHPFLKGQMEIGLHRNMFDHGAMMFKDLLSRNIWLCSRQHYVKIKITFNDFEYLGIWSLVNTPFICIEPLNGLPSSREDSHDIFSKEGIRRLGRQQSISYTHAIAVE